MTNRTFAEALPGRLPSEWFGPDSMTNAGPGLGLCPRCGHQTHAEACGYASMTEKGVEWCGCGE